MCFVEKSQTHEHAPASRRPSSHSHTPLSPETVGFTAGTDKCLRSLRFRRSGGIGTSPSAKPPVVLAATVGDLALRADGRLLAGGCWDNTVGPFPARAARTPIRTRSPPLRLLQFHSRLQDRHIPTPQVRLFQPKGLKPLAVLSFHRQSCHAVAFSPHTGMLASAGVDAKIALWDTFAHTFNTQV